ncbi:MAG: phosphogluconate dehydrogenase [Gammaproteobacteria bacterium]|nr:phosphogluconate dehydrogenase [Gammaproteobacteria bacterium]
MSLLVLLHPGAMGATVGATLRAGGHRVRWVAAGRSEATARRAAAAGLEACTDLSSALQGAHGVVSVCPPDQASAVAAAVEEAGFDGLYVDANAIAPATARSLQARFGERLVDGGIIGPPAQRPGTTRLYLSGAAADAVAAWFRAGPLEAVALADRPAGAASALKMAYAAYTKGSAALLLAVRALAEHEGVAAALTEEWGLSQPGLAERCSAAARGTAPKAWRFVGEMQEIADTFAAAELPRGFHEAAADVYRRLAGFRDAEAAPDAVIRRLLDGSG